MPAPITIPRLDAAILTQLCQRYEDTPNVESRTRYQMILLAQQEYKVPQIARMVLRGEDTVDRARVPACAWLRMPPPHVDLATQSRRASRLRGKRVRVEVLRAATTAPEP